MNDTELYPLPTQKRKRMDGEIKEMTQCNHENCGREHRIWLPIASENNKGDVHLHPWCINCGQIRNISDDKGKKVGYWINMLSRINSHLPITQVQRRLIIQAINDHDGFSDFYSITLSDQKEVFVRIVEQCTNYPYKTIYSWVD